MEYKLTKDFLKIGASRKGGYSAEQLYVFGISWPLKSGWMDRILATPVSEGNYRKFLQLSRRNIAPQNIEKYVSALKTDVHPPFLKNGRKTNSHIENKILPKIVVYTDGACIRNPGGKGGWAFTALWGDKRLSCAGFSPQTTNNRMELTAAIEALESIKDKIDLSACEVIIYSDSQYLVNGARSWLNNWKSRGWLLKNKTPVKNVDLWKKIYIFSDEYFIAWEWVKGHNGNPMNEKCDAMADTVARRQQSFTEYIRKGL